MKKDVKKFEDILNHLLEWNRRQAIEQDVKNVDIVKFGKMQVIINNAKKELIQMYKELN